MPVERRGQAIDIPRSPFSLWSRARARRRQQTDPLDLVEPPGRCSGCRPHDGEVAGGAGEISGLVNLVGGDDGAQAVGANDDRPMLMSASPGRGGGGRAQRATGSSTTDRKICSTDSGGACSRSRSAAATAALNDHQNLAALT